MKYDEKINGARVKTFTDLVNRLATLRRSVGQGRFYEASLTDA